MSTIDSTNPYEALGLTRPKADKKVNNEELGQDQFMQLMLAQMKNQDPLKPMENGEFIAQLAQFSTVSGVQALQESFSSLASSMQSNQALQASGLVGRTVLTQGDTAYMDGTSPVEGIIDMPSSTPSLNLSVYDASGQLVRSIDMGTQASGDVAFSWDGKANDGSTLAAGKYRVVAEAMIDGQGQAMTTEIYSRVESVNLNAGGASGIELNLAGLSTVAFSDVKQVR